MQYSVRKNKHIRRLGLFRRPLERLEYHRPMSAGWAADPKRRFFTRMRRRRLLWAALCLLTVTVVAHGLFSTQGVATRGGSTAPTKPLASTTAPPQASATKSLGLALGDTAVWLTQAQLNKQFSTIASWGVDWIRIDASWADVQPDNATAYNWSGLDRVVATARKYHLSILGTLAYAPAWAEQQPCAPNQMCPPAHNIQFAAFASAAVSRYASAGVHDWEVWNEPNLQGFWQPQPSPLAYTQLLEAADNSIKRVEPTATVISGGLGPLDGNPHSLRQEDFLSGMYQAGAKSYFDELGYHPYSYPALPNYVVSWSGWSSMADVSGSIRSIMAANGDTNKDIWITEYGAPTNGPRAIATVTNPNFDAGPDHVSEALQADMLSQAAKDYQSTPWLNSFFWYSYQDLGTSTATNENFFGLLRADGSAKPAVAALRQAASP